VKPSLCEAGQTLRDQINGAFRDRDKRSDGWIADQRHLAGGVSDHIANADGIVRAVDIDRDLHGVRKPDLMPYLADQLRLLAKSKKDGGRIAYIIFNGFIASPKKSWAFRKYLGPNQHTTHMHVSFTSKGDKDGSLFNIPLLEGK
jgi:hypothetical protein